MSRNTGAVWPVTGAKALLGDQVMDGTILEEGSWGMSNIRVNVTLPPEVTVVGVMEAMLGAFMGRMSILPTDAPWMTLMLLGPVWIGTWLTELTSIPLLLAQAAS
jgi:hypothetical protein